MMKQNKIAYAYKQLFLDKEYVVQGLSNFIQEYIQTMNLQPANPTLFQWLQDHQFLQQASSHWTFSTNLEFVHVPQFRRPDIQQFHRVIHESQIIFHRRWGDAPLRFVLAYLFWNNQQVMKLCHGYVHSMWDASDSTCSSKEQQVPVIRDAVLKQLQDCIPKSTCN